jgi:hydrogenase maturation protease
MAPNILVLGIGNVLLGDEGVGVRVVESLCKMHYDLLADVDLVDGGTLSFSLTGDIEDASAIVVIDASTLGEPPGCMRVMEGQAMDQFLHTHRHRSVHEVGLMDLLAMVQATGKLPDRRALIAIQPQSIEWSETLSEPVANAVGPACTAVTELIKSWQAPCER